MGCDTFVSCPQCRVTHDCGYGSYGTFDERAALFLMVHEHCEGVQRWSSDYTFHQGPDLWLDGRPPKLLMPDELHFKRPRIVQYRGFVIIEQDLAKTLGELTDRTPIGDAIDNLLEFVDLWREDVQPTDR